MRSLIALLCVSVLTGCAASPSTPGAAPVKRIDGMTVLNERDDRIIAQLDNGLVVMAQRISTAPVASVHCYVKTGLIYEGEWNGVGLSHFLEHLVSGGTTTTRTEDENNVMLGRIGASTNAFTSTDLVAYHIDTSAESAPVAIELISDWMQNSTIPDNEFEREKQVIGREFAMGRGEPNRIMWKLTSLIRFDRHPARHPVIGYEDEFVRVTRDELYTFYKRMYVPNNMVFSVAGDIDPREVVAQIAELWEGSRKGKAPKITLQQDDQITAPRSISGSADIAQPRLRIAWPGVRLTTEHDYPLDLLGQILGQGELSRLVRSIRDEKRMVTSIDAYNYSASWGEGFFGVDATVVPPGEIPANVRSTPQQWAKLHMAGVKRAILAEVDRIKEGGVTDAELARAKRNALSSAAFATQTAHEIASRSASDFIHTGDPDYRARYAQAIQSVTKEQIVEAARTYLVHDRLLTTTMLPNTAAPQPFKRPADVADAGGTDEIVDLDNAVLVDKFRKRPTGSSAARAPEVGPMRMHKLDNGLRVLIQRNTSLPIVSMQWYQLGGLLGDDTGKEGVANAAAQMMIKGAGDRTAEAIATMLESRGASLVTSGGNSTTFAAAASLSEDWADVLALMADVVQKPTYPADEWEKLKPRLLAAIAAEGDSWYGQVRNGFREAYFGEHPWAQSLTGRASVVSALTADDLKSYHTARLGAKDGIVTVIGDIDESKALDAVRRHFGAMPRVAPKPFAAKEHGPVQSRTIHVPTNKQTPAVVIGYAPGMKRSNPDYPAMEVMTSVMSSFPVGRLERRLRGSGRGLVYAIGAGQFAQASRGYWSVLFNTQPDTIREAMAGALDEIHRIRSEKIDDATLLRARERTLVEAALARQTNADRGTLAALNELYGLGYDHSAAEMEAYANVSAEDVLRVAKKYLDNPLAAVLSREPIDPAELPALKPAE